MAGIKVERPRGPLIPHPGLAPERRACFPGVQASTWVSRPRQEAPCLPGPIYRMASYLLTTTLRRAPRGSARRITALNYIPRPGYPAARRTPAIAKPAKDPARMNTSEMSLSRVRWSGQGGRVGSYYWTPSDGTQVKDRRLGLVYCRRPPVRGRTAVGATISPR